MPLVSSHLCLGQVSPLRFQGGRARSFFTQCGTLRLVPHVQPILDRLKIASAADVMNKAMRQLENLRARSIVRAA